jgi:hypothetical protein
MIVNHFFEGMIANHLVTTNDENLAEKIFGHDIGDIKGIRCRGNRS